MAGSPRILVADDNPTNRLILVRSLEKAGYEVRTADDGFKAVEIATEYLPDLILLDMMMPRQNGLEACIVLKAQAETAAIPVIFVTAVSDVDQVLNAFTAGGCDYITKPFKPEEVLARISVHVRLRQAEEELLRKNKQLEELAGELAALSRIDSLTKLLNRRTWDEAMVQEHERFQRTSNSYSIIMIDVDGFKAYNDSRGHQAGDECLRRMAEAIASTCRQVDSVGRYGGEEFVILAPDTGAEAAVKLAERIRKAIWRLALPHPASITATRVTASLGVAMSAPGSWEDVLKRADDALYVAKKAGRNMVYMDHGARSKVASLVSESRPEEPGISPDPCEGRIGVLIVDDEPTNRAVCRGCLERAGYQVREAVDGDTAIASINEDPPDVIIMDVMMPSMDGLECTKKIRANPDTRDIPIIMVSALANNDEILAGLEVGADEYLTKPIRTTELTLRVRSMARLYREHSDLLQSYETRGEHMRILTRLVEFCRAIGTSQRLNEVLECTVAAVADVAHSRRISIMLPDDKARLLSIAKSRGIDDELASVVKVPVGEPIAGQVFATGRPIVINSEAQVGAHPGAYDTHFFASVPLFSAPMGAAGQVVGVLNVTERDGQQPFEPHELEYIELINKIAGTSIHDIFTREARDQASNSIMVALAKLAEHRDNDTGLHLDRVTRYCCILAETLRETQEYSTRIDEAFLYDLARAVPLHDIGKVAIPDKILLYPGKLADDEMAIMRTHAAIGGNTIQSLIESAPGVSFLEMAADIARYHHEWYDGSGYPAGLRGDAIPLPARITAIADVYDALTTKRVYKEAVSHDQAVATIVEASGTQFEPAIVEAFIQHEREFAELAALMADDSPRQSALATETQASLP